MTRARDRGGIVADNLRRIVGDEAVTTWCRRYGLNQPTIRRIMVGEISPTEIAIANIAGKLGLLPWMLLVPDMDPRRPPALSTLSDAERELQAKFQQALDILRSAAPAPREPD